jgi:uncharacterized protein YndB with AHSA1/START domain
MTVEEEKPMDRPEFNYVIYIAGSRETVFDALVSGQETRRYWGHRNVSDWRVGSRWRHERDDGGADVVGRVLEFARPERLALSWSAPDADGDPKRTSEVSFDLVAGPTWVKLTVTHTGLDQRSYPGIASGWAKVLSNLKSWVERRDVLHGLI